jgi:hypothetical protein
VKTGAVGHFFVSPHALSRYRSRYRPRLAREAALTELIRLSSEANHVRSFEDGRQLWRGPKRAPVPRLLFVVAPAPEGALPVIETVPGRPKLSPSPDNRLARYRRARRDAWAARLLADSPPAEPT